MSEVMVMGSRGMLGVECIVAASDAGHSPVWSGNSLGGMTEGANIASREWVSKALDAYKPEVVINCAGVHDSYGRMAPTAERMISSNAIGPLVLAEECGKRTIPLIHVSTDCVFSGQLGHGLRYNSFATPDPIDRYGRSKLLGEPEGEHVTVVRTSFIGLAHGLMAWFLSHTHSETIEGWASAMWTGSTVDEVARRLVAMVDDPPGGIVHLATEQPVSKWAVLVHLRQLWPEADRITIERAETPRINRALMPNVEPLPHIESALARYRLEHHAS